VTETHLAYVVDEATTLALARERGPASGYGIVVYRCHTCGDLIPKPWEVLYVDPDSGWCEPFMPDPMPPTMTTHHAYHQET
jgi:hypothetical protein